MARRRRNMDSKEVGLVMGLTVGRYFFGSDDLHYGFWPDDLEVKPGHIKQAQENHAQLILQTIPAGVKTILDVGCGAGALAQRLLDTGYDVEAVSPSGLLTAQARALLGSACPIIEAPFEQAPLPRRWRKGTDSGRTPLGSVSGSLGPLPVGECA